MRKVFRVYFSGWRRGLLCLFLACLLAGCLQPTEEPKPLTPAKAAEPAPPLRSVLLISIDTLRADHLGCYGYERDTSPFLDRLAAEGTLFENVSAQRGLTWPSLMSIMTSLYPVTHGVRQNGQLVDSQHLQLAEILKQKGYRTAAFIANCQHQNWKGFDTLEHLYDAEALEAATAWLKQEQDKPFFLWVHLLAPHWNYMPPAPYDTRFNPGYTGSIDGSNESFFAAIHQQGQLSSQDVYQMRSLYDGEIAWDNDLLADFFSTLDPHPQIRQILTVITADHGEELYDHNRYWDHKESVYQSVLHVPLIFYAPGHVPQGRRVPSVSQSIDIAPTILSFLDMPVPPAFQGTPLSFVPDQGLRDRGPAFSEWEDRILCIRDGNYKYIFNPSDFHPPKLRGEFREKFLIDTRELYDLSEDPNETENLVGIRPAIAENLHEKLMDWKEDYGWQLNTDPYSHEPMIPEIEEQLRALGYLE